MTATTIPDETSVADRLRVPRDVRVSTIKGGRFVRNRLATWAMVVAFLLATLPLMFVVFNVVAKGGGVVSPGFLSRDIPTTAAATELKNDCETRKLYAPTAVCETQPAAAVEAPNLSIDLAAPRRPARRARQAPTGIPLDANAHLASDGFEVLSAAELDAISQARN